jgi:hypothetical protein
MSQTTRGSAISNRTIGRCIDETWLQFLLVGTKIKGFENIEKHAFQFNFKQVNIETVKK